MLAAAGPRLDDRLLPDRGGVAPPAQFDPRLLETAIRLRQGRGAARGQMAAALQRARPHRLGRADLWLRSWARQSAAAAHLSRRLGHGTLPVGAFVAAKSGTLAVGDA